ncbi:putative HET-domain-containing protein [Seiridium unicorne]|uniref:HET-domain-containing protein n=1 Tax=Seiridium unicorne TaxID=138068 RepID=A0ABR2UZS8_9PEZI
MPSWIIDVSDKTKVKLFQVPAITNERYVALSYCWGTDRQTTMLTLYNKYGLLSGIDPHHLDPTIRDSVMVTRELEFRFLWIDALCIFQDDKEWKTKELGIMGKLCQNATLTIVASTTKDVKEGFLHCRVSTTDRASLLNKHPPGVLKFRAQGTSEEGDEKPVILTQPMEDDMEPWYERAWTLQEMLFSGRQLRFRNNQTTWLCHCTEPPARECDGWMSGRAHVPENHWDSNFKEIMPMMRGGKGRTWNSEVLSNWYDLIEVYSCRKLRYRDDRLPAMSGIARGFVSILGDQYMCGFVEVRFNNRSDVLVNMGCSGTEGIVVLEEEEDRYSRDGLISKTYGQ